MTEQTTNPKMYYMVVYWVDLGYTVCYMYNNPKDAEQKCNEVNTAARNEQIGLLITAGRFTEEQAVKWMSNHGDYYSVEAIELSECNGGER